jgi:hypothetical protein
MTKKILFVEDHVELIDEVITIILMLHPDWTCDVAFDFSEAWSMLGDGNYDTLVIDVMLPAPPYLNKKPLSEGIQLALFVMEIYQPHSDWTPLNLEKKPEIIFLTSRTASGVEDEFSAFVAQSMSALTAVARTKSKRLPSEIALPKVISRLEGDAYTHANTICYQSK